MSAPNWNPNLEHLRHRKHRYDAAAPGFFMLDYCPLVPGDSSPDSVIKDPILYWALCTEAHASESYMVGSICAVGYFSHGAHHDSRTILGPHGGVEDIEGLYSSVAEWLAAQVAKGAV